MTLYADADFYTNTYLEGRKSVIEPACINAYLRKAQKLVKNFTFDNIDEESEIPYEVKMCICEVAEMLYTEAQDEAFIGLASSESVEGWSKSYENSQQRKSAANSKIKDCVYLWLSDIGLLFCGVKKC